MQSKMQKKLLTAFLVISMSGVDYLFIDSGTGGLPYMLQLKTLLPESRCVYVGDTKHFPYGERELDDIRRLSVELTEKCIEKFNPKVIVIACNTISVSSLDVLRKRFSVPFVGTVPAIKLAASLTKNKCIGLLATSHTVNDKYTDDLIDRFAKDCSVVRRGDAELVSFIEHNLFTASYEERCKAVTPAVEFFKSRNADSIVLACTHFIHLRREFEDVAGSGVQVIDSREGVAKQAVHVLLELDGNNRDIKREPEQVPDQAVYVTGLRSSQDEAEYRSWCARSNVPFMGTL